MAAGGTVDCSTICLLLPLHKIPSHIAVKKEKRKAVARRVELREIVVHLRLNRRLLSLQEENPIYFFQASRGGLYFRLDLSASSANVRKSYPNLYPSFLDPF